MQIDPAIFKQQALEFAAQFEFCCLLDSHQYADKYGKFDCIIAMDAEKQLSVPTSNAFDSLKKFIDENSDWAFGLFTYDLKNELELLSSKRQDELDFPDLFFFIPKIIIAINGNIASVIKGAEDILQQIAKFPKVNELNQPASIHIEAKISRESYLEKVAILQKHIQRGDIYEVNFCQEFFAKNAKINPLQVYQQLGKISPSPFSGFLKIGNRYVLSASPERYLAKRGNKIISQPIKGTAKRSSDESQDAQHKNELANSLKEQSENVMIVDLVRNDLTKCAAKGTVQVEELFGIYSFPQVHQMISTVVCELDTHKHWVDAIKNTFPMGSMTGAPKLRAMQLIDDVEESKRGAYSGAMGYIHPEGDFDFNVIIRSLLYNQSSNYLSFQVGSAITSQSNANREYEECLLKASAIRNVLSDPLKNY
jgi:para-aminobenzoate synthetase component 1